MPDMIHTDNDADEKIQEIFRLAEKLSRVSGYYIVQVFVRPEGAQRLHISDTMQHLVRSQILPETMSETPAFTSSLKKIIGHLVGLSLAHKAPDPGKGGETSGDSSGLYESIKWTAAEEAIVRAIEGLAKDDAVVQLHQQPSEQTAEGRTLLEDCESPNPPDTAAMPAHSSGQLLPRPAPQTPQLPATPSFRCRPLPSLSPEHLSPEYLLSTRVSPGQPLTSTPPPRPRRNETSPSIFSPTAESLPPRKVSVEDAIDVSGSSESQASVISISSGSEPCVSAQIHQGQLPSVPRDADVDRTASASSEELVTAPSSPPLTADTSLLSRWLSDLSLSPKSSHVSDISESYSFAFPDPAAVALVPRSSAVPSPFKSRPASTLIHQPLSPSTPLPSFGTSLRVAMNMALLREVEIQVIGQLVRDGVEPVRWVDLLIGKGWDVGVVHGLAYAQASDLGYDEDYML